MHRHIDQFLTHFNVWDDVKIIKSLIQAKNNIKILANVSFYAVNNNAAHICLLTTTTGI